MNTHFKRLRMLRLATNLDWDNIYQQHLLLVKFIKNNMEEAAVNMMKKHLTMIILDKEKIRNEYPTYFK
jgi:GntR family transcriptional regulator, rspAB operon transcriptional repressor